MIDKFGGHAMAAGLTINAENLTALAEHFRAVVRDRLVGVDTDPTPLSDGPLEPRFLSVEVAELLRNAGPWGQHFPEPTFDGQFELLDGRIVGERHFSMMLQAAPGSRPIKAIAFRQTPAFHSGTKLWLTYRLAVDDYGNHLRPQLIVETMAAVEGI